MDEKLKKIIIIVLSVFILIILFLFIISGCNKKNYKMTDLEDIIIKNARNYYENNKDELPGLNDVKTIDLTELVSKNIIDDLNKILDKKTTCSGNLKIENNNNYYMYSPNISCKNESETYNTKILKDVLLDNVVTNGNGLYNMYNSYYFRGDNVNNYIIFDGILWRIVKINSDNSIKLIETGKITKNSVKWDDRFNEDTNNSTGINDYVRNNINSRIKDTLDNIYNDDNILSKSAKGYIKKTDLCIGKRGIEDTINNGSIECNSILPNQYVGLLQLNEYLIASLDENCLSSTSKACSNYNYLSELGVYWSITANKEGSNTVFKIGKPIITSNASTTSYPRLVINISENTNVTGNGTKDDPYIVVGFDKTLKK